MSHVRELLDDARGPIFIELEANALEFEVKMERRSGILVELRTDGGPKSEEAKLIDTARLERTRDGYKVVVDVPNSVSIVRSNGGRTSISNVVISGGGRVFQVGNGNVQINSFGRRGSISSSGLVLEHGIDVTVYVPEDSSVLVNKGGGLTVAGRANVIETDFSGGDVDFDQAAELRIRTSGGDITGNFVSRHANVRTSGGDIDLGEVQGDIDLETSGGNVTLETARGNGRMRTSGGNVTLRSFHGQRLSMKTSGGNIKHPRHEGIDARTTGGRVRVS